MTSKSKNNNGNGGIKVTWKMSGKMKGLFSINTSSLDNPFCERMSQTDSVCAKCYSRRMLASSRKSCREPWASNGEALSKRLILDRGDLPTFEAGSTVRFSAHGELINATHLANLVNICDVNPDSTFTLWTKRVDLVNELFTNWEKPINLILIYSDSKIDGQAELPNDHFDKVFHVHSKGSAQPINCGSRDCSGCMKCYTLGETTTHIHETVK